MGTKLATRQDTRLALIEAGIDIMLEKGYNNTGIQEVLSSLGVPKGSFYHYFESKENFALAIIRHIDEEYDATVRSILTDTEKTPLARLRTYCENGKAGMQSHECRKGCLIGNLSQEMSDQSETLRQELSAVMGRRANQVAACIAEGQERGEITTVTTPARLAELFMCGWFGAVAMSKTLKQISPIDNFIDLMFGYFLKV